MGTYEGTDALKASIKEAILAHHLIEASDMVLVALSGGADSVCLLRILLELSGEMGFTVRAGHVNHGLRGEEADRDEAFCLSLCRELSVPLEVFHVDVGALVRRGGLGEEEAARKLRYEALLEAAKRMGGEASRVAVAHHRRDQAETILHNILRGSGLGGLKGMAYKRGQIIRPFLKVPKEAILAWLSGHGQSYVEDSTNTSGAYTRNRIRNQLLPAAKELVNCRAEENLLKLSGLAGMADSYLEECAECWFKTYACPQGEGRIFVPQEAFAEAQAVVFYGIRRIIKVLCGSCKDFGLEHVRGVVALLNKSAGRRIDLPSGLEVKREYAGIGFCRKGADVSGDGAIPRLEITVFDCTCWEDFPKNRYTKWFDYDKIKDVPVLRHRREGDYLSLHDGRHKALRRFFIDEKVPVSERDDVWLLADGSHIMWVLGRRISSAYKVSACTKRVFCVTCKGVGDGAESAVYEA